VQIAPEDFGKPSYVAIEDNLNAKYANKVRDASRKISPTQSLTDL
jgi:DNA-directed RNA polymerase III subunit RPC8